MNKVTIECKNITKRLGDGASYPVLRNVNLQVHENEMVMLMGPSGSGKTTLISIIGGLLEQDEGDCLILGKPINQMLSYEKTLFRGKSIGFLFQYFTLVPTITAVENAAISLILNGIKRNEALQKASELLLKVGLDKQRFYFPQQLSGGEQQRIAMVRSFIHKPNIILCDEPTSFLDHERGQYVMELLRTMQKETGCSVIVVTHNPRIVPFADRILEIEDGQVNHKHVD